MERTKAVVRPVITGPDYCEPGVPLPLERDSRKEALRALRREGSAVKDRLPFLVEGNEVTVYTVTVHPRKRR